ncbi:MAG TPA: hypothetical protein VG347_17635, partial [Verrucomicrobiae bacterium]|nr:hypothetical protein [Verrucomicrobiae bacterium]
CCVNGEAEVQFHAASNFACEAGTMKRDKIFAGTGKSMARPVAAKRGAADQALESGSTLPQETRYWRQIMAADFIRQKIYEH